MKGALLFLLGWVALLLSLLYQHISLYARSLTHTYTLLGHSWQALCCHGE